MGGEIEMKYADITKLKHKEGFMSMKDVNQIKDQVVEYVVQERKPRTNYLPPVSENYTRQQRMADFMKRYDEGEYDVSGKDVF